MSQRQRCMSAFQYLDRLHQLPRRFHLRRHRLFMTGLTLFGLVVLTALAAGLLAPHSPNQNNFRYRLGAPTGTYLLGTDGFGRDVLSRVLHGARVSLRIGLMVVVLNGILGTLIGSTAGYFRRLDNVIMRLMDGLMAFPAILLAIALVATLGASEINVVLALTAAYAPRTARIVRASVLVIREMEYVQAAIATGAGYLGLRIVPSGATTWTGLNEPSLCGTSGQIAALTAKLV